MMGRAMSFGIKPANNPETKRLKAGTCSRKALEVLIEGIGLQFLFVFFARPFVATEL